MPPSTVPFPPSGSFIESVRTSSARIVEASNIDISPSSIRAFLLSLSRPTYVRLSQQHGTATSLPLSFPNALSELNLLSVLSLLNLGSSFRAPLHAFHQRGAYDSVRFFVLSAFISSDEGNDLLSAKGMRAMTDEKVAELFGGLPLMVERKHETLPVMVGEKGGRLAELVGIVRRVMNEAGEVLVKGGYDSLGAFVEEALRDGKERSKGDEYKWCEHVVERLVKEIPGFQDMYEIDGQPVYLFKKALFLLHVISLRYPSSSSSTPSQPFPVPSTTDLVPIFSDNVIPSLLLNLSLITLPSSSPILPSFPNLHPASSNPLLSREAPPAPAEKANPPTGGPVLTEKEAAVLRAAAVHACEKVVEYVQQGGMDGEEGCEWMKDGEDKLTATGIDGYIWSGGKDRWDWRVLERFVTDSAFF